MVGHGFPDACCTAAGTDEGVDVTAADGIAQIKAQVKPVGRPALQQFAGIAHIEKKVGLFFSLGGFTVQAEEWAERADLALFGFDLAGDVEPLNDSARALVEAVKVVEGKDPGVEDPQNNSCIFSPAHTPNARRIVQSFPVREFPGNIVHATPRGVAVRRRVSGPAFTGDTLRLITVSPDAPARLVTRDLDVVLDDPHHAEDPYHVAVAGGVLSIDTSTGTRFIDVATGTEIAVPVLLPPAAPQQSLHMTNGVWTTSGRCIVLTRDTVSVIDPASGDEQRLHVPGVRPALPAQRDISGAALVQVDSRGQMWVLGTRPDRTVCLHQID
jgi:hypothetical protein